VLQLLGLLLTGSTPAIAAHDWIYENYDCSVVACGVVESWLYLRVAKGSTRQHSIAVLGVELPLHLKEWTKMNEGAPGEVIVTFVNAYRRTWGEWVNQW
jgi:hypothetical protein